MAHKLCCWPVELVQISEGTDDVNYQAFVSLFSENV